MYLQSGYFLMTTIHEEKKYVLNVNIVIKSKIFDLINLSYGYIYKSFFTSQKRCDVRLVDHRILKR
jgi:hypothetical protein